ncbi:regulatory protein ToxS [Vibrio sp. CK2-1]|uniref:regulatory protein ToxS n=1 Tax=Vibrio sp. CK2-1 TaxID=2912249 RepID=UPI001F3DAB9C|nr:regulatory protein ToxS [Vibrio sp. CK2-1]MCF7354374.1 regulatory protein ToxS [Vibrio sp. CK2-1]
MKKTISIIALVVALIGSWNYWQGDIKLKQELTSREWQSTTIAYMNFWDQKIQHLDKASISSTVKYLPNQTYIKNSTLIFTSKDIEKPVEIIISESGSWELSDHYLIVDASEFKDISTTPITQITPVQVEKLKTLFKINAQQSRKIDVVNDRTLLLTSLAHGSTVLFSQ